MSNELKEPSGCAKSDNWQTIKFSFHDCRRVGMPGANRYTHTQNSNANEKESIHQMVCKQRAMTKLKENKQTNDWIPPK